MSRSVRNKPKLKVSLLNSTKGNENFFLIETNPFHSKSVNNGKTRIAAKKIANIDLDSLTLEDENFVNIDKPTDTAVSSMGALASEPVVVEEVVEVKPVVVVKSTPTISNEDRLKKFSGAKSISSDSFRDNE